MTLTPLWFSNLVTGSLSELAGTPLATTLSSISTDVVMTGAFSLQCPSGAWAAALPILGGVDQTDMYFRGYVYLPSKPTLKTSIWNIGAVPIWVTPQGALQTDFGIDVLSDPTAVKFPLGKWVRLEAHVVSDATTGGMEILVDGASVLSDFTKDTSSVTMTASTVSAITASLHWTFGPLEGGDQTIYYANMMCGTGGWFGPGICIGRQCKIGAPTDDAWDRRNAGTGLNSTSNPGEIWIKTPAENDHWMEPPADDTTVKQTGLVADIGAAPDETEEPYRGTEYITTDSTINACAVIGGGLYSPALSPDFSMIRIVNAAETVTGPIQPLLAQVASTSFNTDPFGDGIFTASLADLQGMEMGVEGHIGSLTNPAQVFGMWLIVDYTPPAIVALPAATDIQFFGDVTGPGHTPFLGLDVEVLP